MCVCVCVCVCVRARACVRVCVEWTGGKRHGECRPPKALILMASLLSDNKSFPFLLGRYRGLSLHFVRKVVRLGDSGDRATDYRRGPRLRVQRRTLAWLLSQQSTAGSRQRNASRLSIAPSGPACTPRRRP